MARIVTSGAELYASSSTFYSEPDGATTGTVTRDTTTFRSGVASFKCDSGAGNAAAYARFGHPVVSDGRYGRVYVNLTDLPASTVAIVLADGLPGLEQASIRVTSGGVVQLYANGAQVGSNGPTLSTGTWYRLEMEAWDAGAGASIVSARVDGTEFAASSSVTFPDSGFAFDGLHAGWHDAPGANKVMYVDDIAHNSTTGTDQNSWPGSGKVVLLKPISTAQNGSWTGGSGGTTNLWTAVDNIPPAGTATESDTTQVESIDASPDNATDEFRVNLTTYSSAGIVAADTINLIESIVFHGEDVTTGTKTGSFGGQANPAFTYGTFSYGNDVGLLGTWPANWRHARFPTYNPSVTLGSSMVMALRKTDTGTRVASCCFMGAYVDYTPAVAAAAVPFSTPMPQLLPN